MDAILERNMRLEVRPAEFELAQDGVEYCSHVVGLGKKSPAQLKRKEESCGECSEEVGEKGFRESRSPTFQIDSTGKDKRRTGFEDPDWSQTA
ncbi:hypothetical protein TNCV_1487491 [Trichonephila clavipes]|nr:hypothetical protein TNCV_1487491 [Trichonephila clavipes]